MLKIIKKLLPYEIKILIQDILYHYRKLKIILLKCSIFGFSNLDNKLSKYLNYKNGFYIELGANDGVFASNTYYLQKKLNWNGILIEPSPNLFTRCKKIEEIRIRFCVMLVFQKSIKKNLLK